MEEEKRVSKWKGKKKRRVRGEIVKTDGVKVVDKK